jgi:hypothetical protein
LILGWLWQERDSFRLGWVVMASMFNLSYVILVNMVLTAIVSGTYRDI